MNYNLKSNYTNALYQIRGNRTENHTLFLGKDYSFTSITFSFICPAYEKGIYLIGIHGNSDDMIEHNVEELWNKYGYDILSENKEVRYGV